MAPLGDGFGDAYPPAPGAPLRMLEDIGPQHQSTHLSTETRTARIETGRNAERAVTVTIDLTDDPHQGEPGAAAAALHALGRALDGDARTTGDTRTEIAHARREEEAAEIAATPGREPRTDSEHQLAWQMANANIEKVVDRVIAERRHARRVRLEATQGQGATLGDRPAARLILQIHIKPAPHTGRDESDDDRRWGTQARMRLAQRLHARVAKALADHLRLPDPARNRIEPPADWSAPRWGRDMLALRELAGTAGSPPKR